MVKLNFKPTEYWKYFIIKYDYVGCISKYKDIERWNVTITLKVLSKENNGNVYGKHIML